MEWWKQYEEYITVNEVHIITREREEAIQSGHLEKMGYDNPEDFMKYYKDGRQVIFNFDGHEYSVIYFPHQMHHMLTNWVWEVYSFEEGEPVGKARTVDQLNNILAECFRKSYIK